VSKQDQREPIRELLDSIRRELNRLNPNDYGKIAELRQALESIGRQIDMMREKTASSVLAQEKSRETKRLGLGYVAGERLFRD